MKLIRICARRQRFSPTCRQMRFCINFGQNLKGDKAKKASAKLEPNPKDKAHPICQRGGINDRRRAQMRQTSI